MEIPKLDDVERDALDGPLTYKECKKSLDTLENGKSPGEDDPLSPYLFILTAEILSNKVRQNSTIKGIRIFGSEIKLSQFADDTNLFCADVASVEQSLETVNTFGNFSGLVLNVEKTKAFWLGKWLNNRTKPLGMKWMNTPTKLLGVFVSYDKKGNNRMNYNLKVQKLQTNLDIGNRED